MLFITFPWHVGSYLFRYRKIRRRRPICCSGTRWQRTSDIYKPLSILAKWYVSRELLFCINKYWGFMIIFSNVGISSDFIRNKRKYYQNWLFHACFSFCLSGTCCQIEFWSATVWLLSRALNFCSPAMLHNAVWVSKRDVLTSIFTGHLPRKCWAVFLFIHHILC